MNLNFKVFLTLCLVISSQSKGVVPAFLKRWEKNPLTASLEAPVKKGMQGPIKFSQEDLKNNNFVTLKDESRLEICRSAGMENCDPGFEIQEGIADVYALTRFAGKAPVTNIYSFDGYKEGASEVTPWTSTYWPYYEGGIGIRYADTKFPHSKLFIENFKYYEKNYVQPVHKIKDFNLLSPAEKYDLLNNDPDWTLNYNSWALGRRRYQMSGNVETWMGICHGWAPAAIMVPEPNTSFKLNLPSINKTVTFYPDDVKALVSQQWAAARVPSVVIGGRCDDRFPAADANGRIISSQCFDTNPGAWHIALINWMGISRQSFVFDATYDFEVWNQPISSYSITYFNPISKDLVDNLNDAIVSYSDYSNDPYKSYRSSATRSIVGVQLKLKYVVESLPYQREGYVELQSPQREVTYFYDLELDEQKNIIGGEWYQRAHPDMMWRPTLKRPIVDGETLNLFWNGTFPIPFNITSQAKNTSKLNRPLGAIMDKLQVWSHR